MSRQERRAFLRTVGAGAIGAFALSAPRLRAQASPSGSETLAGSPRWPGGAFRASDVQNRFQNATELMALEKRLKPNDMDSYLSEWSRVRDAAITRAGEFEKSGRLVSAGDAYIQAAHYASRVYILYLRLGDPVRAKPAYADVKKLFAHGISLAGPALPYEAVSIPYGTTTLKGIFAKAPGPPGVRRPVVYRTGGTDSVKEGSYISMAWSAFVDRGVSCLMIDAPGQGEALNEQGLTFIPDFEKPVTAAVTYLAKRPDVDPARIGLYGVSTGGYFAQRGAAFDKRLAAVALQGVCYDMLADCYDYCPSFRPHLRFMIGASSDAEARTRLADYNCQGLGPKITLPVAMVHGKNDDAVRVEGAQRFFKEVASAEKSFTPVDASHNLDVSIRDLVDWLTAKVQGRKTGVSAGGDDEEE
jgi:fermentation-respiration switch protein FrsA (DUF1100 family)